MGNVLMTESTQHTWLLPSSFKTEKVKENVHQKLV